MAMENQTIYAPKSLIDTAEASFANIKTIENHLLFWQFIDSWPYADDTKEDWRVINDKCFSIVVSNQNLRGEIRKWLEIEGFIRIKKFRKSDGTLVNHYIPDKESLKYQAICDGPLIPYELVSKDYWNRLSAYTEDDWLCQATRNNMALLSKKTGEKPRYQDEKARKNKKNRDIHSLYNLRKNLGNVKRGHQVNRLFSPWVTCSKDVRSCFLFGGCGISSLDLKAAHPTLIGRMAGDQKLLADCKSDALYQGIAQMLEQSRDEAKKAFMAYGYGRNRINGYGNKEAFQVQEWMRKEYPVAAGFVTKEKAEKDYEQFSISLQNLEAKIFVDGIFKELTHEGILALTVHDAIYFRTQDLGPIREIAHKHLDFFIPDGNYTLEEEKVSKGLENPYPYLYEHSISELVPESYLLA